MRQLLYRELRWVWVTASALAVLAAAPRELAAQRLSKDGALFLILPIGARSVGTGLAVVASEPGSEGVWGNPASLARVAKTEIAINHSSTFIGDANALVLVLPRGRAGVLAVAGFLLSYPPSDATDRVGNKIGVLYPRDAVLAATYAATFGSRIRAGLTYKYAQHTEGCSGACLQEPAASSTGLDVGVQAVADHAARWTVGAGLRNLGFRLQFRDAPQKDPLPTRLHLGAQYLVAAVERLVSDGEARVSGELVSLPSFGQRSVRVGGEFIYRKQFFLRAGYASGNDAAAGASIGFGVQRGGISLDFARTAGGVSSDVGSPPTYVTLRFRF